MNWEKRKFEKYDENEKLWNIALYSFSVIKVCIKVSSIILILSLIIFCFPLGFKISLLFAEIYE